jgi:hypothetical protein
MITFDPYWRVRLEGEPEDAESRCPRCGAELDKNYFIRRAEEGTMGDKGQERV